MKRKIDRRTAIRAGVGAAFAAVVSGALPYETLANAARPSGIVTRSASAKNIMPRTRALGSRSLAEQNDYKTSVVVVNSVMTSVITSTLPILNYYPPDWSAFQAAYEYASADAINWVNTVMARLLDVPGKVQDYNDVITAILQDASQQASILITQPTNQTALVILKRDLNVLYSRFESVTAFIMSAITSIQTFQYKLPDMANQLQSIAQRSIADAKVVPDPADASTLQMLSANYARMADQTQQVQANLQIILTEWQTLASDVNAAIAETKTAFSDTTANNFQAVVNDLNQVFTEWNAAYSQAGSLSIQVNVNTTQL